MRLRRNLSGIAALVCSGTAAACPGARMDVPTIELVEPPLVATTLLADRPETLEDTLGLSSPNDLLAVPGGYIVVDTGNDRLIGFDRDLRPVRTFGRSGSGPGELEIPILARASGRDIGVVELSNGRISFFDPDGRFLRTLTLPVPAAQTDFGPEGFAYVASAGGAAYLTRIGPDGTARPFGARPDPEGDASPIAGGNGVAVVAGRVLVLDDAAAELHAFDLDGNSLGRARLPEELVGPVRRRNEAFAADLQNRGIRVVKHPISKGTTAQPDGRVLILVAEEASFGLLVDARTLTGRLLTVPRKDGVWQRLLGARAAVIEGETITALHGFGLSRFRLVEKGP